MEFLPAVGPSISRNPAISCGIYPGTTLAPGSGVQRDEEDTMALDPVCMMEITPDSAEAQLVYEGETIYFCCDECKRIFDADPETFLDEIEPVGEHAGRDS
jgi:YHS domain-containing protein